MENKHAFFIGMYTEHCGKLAYLGKFKSSS